MPAPGWFRHTLGGAERRSAGEPIVGAVIDNSVPADRGVTLKDREADVPGGAIFRCGRAFKPGPLPTCLNNPHHRASRTAGPEERHMLPMSLLASRVPGAEEVQQLVDAVVAHPVEDRSALAPSGDRARGLKRPQRGRCGGKSDPGGLGELADGQCVLPGEVDRAEEFEACGVAKQAKRRRPLVGDGDGVFEIRHSGSSQAPLFTWGVVCACVQ